MTHLLEVEALKVHFPVRRGLLGLTVGHVHAVDGVSFTLREGETLGIVGESGCGKTTAGMAILHLEKPTSGRVSYQGRSLEEMDQGEMRALRKEMQIIFQDPYPRSTRE